MKGRVVVPLVLLAAIGLGVWWWFENFERVPGKERVGHSGEARVNPFLAAERFVQRMGMRATKLRSRAGLERLEGGSVLLLSQGRQSLDPPSLQRVRAWVSNGGHAIVEAERPELGDPLLDAFGVKRAAQSRPRAPPPHPQGLFNAIGLKVTLAPGEKPLTVIFNQDSRIEPGARTCAVQVLDRDKTALCSFRHGKGMVTAASSIGFAHNGRIGLQDNAEFLWRVATLTDAGTLNVYFRPERLSLWGFLTSNALPVLAAGALLLLAWLWHIVPRFGPVAPDAPPARRRLLDHLRASGRYYWQKGMRPRLVLAARDAALWRLSRAQPDFSSASQGEKAKRLSALIKIPSEEAARFLAAGGAMRGADLIRVTQHAQKIHSALEKGDK